MATTLLVVRSITPHATCIAFAAILLSSVVRDALSATWSSASAGDLLENSNWSGGVAPNVTGQSAIIAGGPSLGGIYDLVGSMTLTQLLHDVPGFSNIIGSGSLILDIASGTPEIEFSGGPLLIATTIAGAQGLNKTGSGTLYVSANNTYTGRTFVSAGTLSGNTIANQGVNSSFGATSNGFSISNGATLEYTGTTNSTDRSLILDTGGGAFSVTNAGTMLALTGNNVTGAGGLTKTGAGVLILTGSNSYTGVNTISAGTLSGNSIANSGSNSAFGRGNFVLSDGVARSNVVAACERFTVLRV